MQFFTRVIALAAAVPFLAQATPVKRAPAIGDAVPGKYIVQLKSGMSGISVAAHHAKLVKIHAANIHRRSLEEEGAGVEHEYNMGKFVGYSGGFDAATIEELKAMPEVVNIEEDSIMTTLELDARDMTTQSAVDNWGLGSISSRKRGATDYIYDNTAGDGSFNYIVDTGVRASHKEFGGRASIAYNAVNTKDQDTAGHGTHVAGIIGGSTYGVAKKTTILSVKVFEGNSGTTATVIKGFEWAVNDIVAKSRQTKAVINMSLGGAGSTTWDAAVTEAWEQGVLAVVASGNENVDASTRSPARSPEAITVGNVQSNDARYAGSQGSNYGSGVDIFAAGTGIVSSWYTSDSATQSLSGTSMASPHVAGLVSYIRGLEGAMSAEDVTARVLALATTGRVTDRRGSADRLAYNGNGR
ncbi:subtilisin-like protease-like protein [Polyplosphaeria fusca]|uniref:Subtilisin-like protease-like protein n=1 Tax=Polyplosphaeria fusca TaxID=682080 RepID=A0A9P4QN39_9PLEO|nr:subtilisin-like protease-like protein [Polyplosphaeria fusca]